MIRLAANRPFRLVIALALIFCLVYGPLYSLNPARAESPALPKETAAPQQITKPHKRGEIIIKFTDDTPKQVRDQIVQTCAKDEKELRGRSKASKLTIKDGLDLANTIFDLKQFTSIVEFAEPNYIVTRTGDLNASSRRAKRSRRSAQLPTTPNDPQFAAQWALANTGQGGGVPGSDINAIGGWGKTTGSRDTIIAVIDTGVDINHPDLADNIRVNKREEKGKKNEDDDRDGYVDDINGWNFVSDNGSLGIAVGCPNILGSVNQNHPKEHSHDYSD
jgi:subtilisin family serine protease